MFYNSVNKMINLLSPYVSYCAVYAGLGMKVLSIKYLHKYDDSKI